MAGIVVSGLVKEFPSPPSATNRLFSAGVRALDKLDVTVEDGEFFALLGPSGCGKTTLLRTIAGLEPPTSGTVHIGERDVTRLEPGARDVAMVFQDYALFPHMTVSENISYPLRVRRRPRAERTSRAAEVGAQLALSSLLDRRPAALSGGQQQRVALARAVAVRPAAFLFDEPLSNLDARLRLEARTFLKRLQRELAVTTVFVTHDQAEALALADRIAVMEAGRIRQVGTPREVFGRPANTFVANFIGSTPMNLLDGSVHDGQLSVAGASLPWKGSLSDGEKVVVGIRPEYLTLSTADPGGPSLRGTVSVSENLGTSALVSVAVGEELVGAVVPEEAEPPADTPVWLVPQAGRVLVYRASDGELVA